MMLENLTDNDKRVIIAEMRSKLIAERAREIRARQAAAALAANIAEMHRVKSQYGLVSRQYWRAASRNAVEDALYVLAAR